MPRRQIRKTEPIALPIDLDPEFLAQLALRRNMIDRTLEKVKLAFKQYANYKFSGARPQTLDLQRLARTVAEIILVDDLLRKNGYRVTIKELLDEAYNRNIAEPQD